MMMSGGRHLIIIHQQIALAVSTDEPSKMRRRWRSANPWPRGSPGCRDRGWRPTAQQGFWGRCFRNRRQPFCPVILPSPPLRTTAAAFLSRCRDTEHGEARRRPWDNAAVNRLNRVTPPASPKLMASVECYPRGNREPMVDGNPAKNTTGGGGAYANRLWMKLK
jgi:hypothetical protein